MNDAMKFIYRITSGGANHGVIESFSGRNSYWFASILFRRFIRNNAAIMYDPKIIVSEQELEGKYTM